MPAVPILMLRHGYSHGAKNQKPVDPIDRACYMALAELGLAMVTHRGRLGADHDALVGLALRLFCSHYGPVSSGSW